MRFLFPSIATIAAILLVSQAAIAGDLFPKVVVTVAPLKPYVDEILHGRGEAQNLLRPGQGPHNFALTVTQATMLAEADLVIVPDLDINPALKTLLAKNKQARVIELSTLEGALPLPYAANNPWLSAMKEAEEAHEGHDEHDHHEHHHDHDGSDHASAPMNDPHLWLDPERMAAIATPLAEAMAERMPEARADLIANAKTLASHLRTEVIPALKEMLNKPATTRSAVEQEVIPFITYHAAYQYFLERFGLNRYGEITVRPEETMGGKTVAELVSRAEKIRLRCLISEQEGTLVKRIAKVTGARIVLLSPEQLVDRADAKPLDWIRNDYDRFLYVTAKAFSDCL